ncbi:hypothetical protein H0X48_02060 [Candidatus Dependentiae bacterium]|nr:hypothetical protein [Candidatus Dependentiae bacterium]
MNKKILFTISALGFMGLCKADARYINTTPYPIQITATYTGSSGAFKSEKGAQQLEPGESKLFRTGGDVMTSVKLAVDYYGNGTFTPVETKKPSSILGLNFGWWAPQLVEAHAEYTKDGSVNVVLDVQAARNILQN